MFTLGEAFYTATASFFIGAVIALPYGIYRLVRKPKAKPEPVKVEV